MNDKTIHEGFNIAELRQAAEEGRRLQLRTLGDFEAGKVRGKKRGAEPLLHRMCGPFGCLGAAALVCKV